jgi:O-acetyl-ADP-ribose deacetylase (regulator of RNase III)
MNIVRTNILDVTDGVIIHGCNCRGAYASGLAGQIAKRYPQAREVYMEYLRARAQPWDTESLLGDIVPARVSETLVIVNAFTQPDYGRQPGVQYVSPVAVQAAFSNLCDRQDRAHVLPVFKHLHYPKIGGGLGGGDWGMIHTLIQLIQDRHPGLEFTFHDYDPKLA